MEILVYENKLYIVTIVTLYIFRKYETVFYRNNTYRTPLKISKVIHVFRAPILIEDFLSSQKLLAILGR